MKAFIITLKKIPESFNTAKKMVKTLRKNGFDAKLFEGTYGDQAYELFHKQGRTLHPTDHAGLPTKPTRKVLGPGVKGCFYSHYRLWKKCIKLNQPIFIFEDDVKFYRPYYPVEFDEVLIIALGSWLEIVGNDTVVNLENEPTCDPTALKYTGSCLPGAVGYGITPVAAKKLVKEFSKTFTAADSAIRSSIVDIKIHSHLIGRALVESDGKVSLTKKRDWLDNISE